MKTPASTAALALALLLPRPMTALPPPAMPSETRISRAEYHGWPDAVRLSNGIVETIVVPSVGRVMQFHFSGDGGGPFWENRAADGKPPAPDAQGWANYGGDKVWPAPQAAWPRIAGRGWPPPAGFDGRPAEVETGGGGVTLVFPEDPAYGLRVRRRITLAPERPVMTITTTFEKLSGPPVEAGIWTITQAREPVAVDVELPRAAPGLPYVALGGYAPPVVRTRAGSISLSRDPAANHKIGLRAGTIRWVGRGLELRLDTELDSNASYPDQGSAAEIYTNADPLPYVELELLGPLATMKAGDRIEQTVTYTLSRRREGAVRRLAAP